MCSEHKEVEVNVGEIILTRRLCDLWCEDLDESLEIIEKGSILLVLQKGLSRRPKRLNVNLYRKVLTPMGNVGWVNLDNCQVERDASSIHL